jgi:hypothetical protein
LSEGSEKSTGTRMSLIFNSAGTNSITSSALDWARERVARSLGERIFALLVLNLRVFVFIILNLHLLSWLISHTVELRATRALFFAPRFLPRNDEES